MYKRQTTNNATGVYSVVAGGTSNTVLGEGGAILGGEQNRADDTADHSVIGGGWYNTAWGSYSTVVGGMANKATANYAAVLGGYSNKANGRFSTVVGGAQNTIQGRYGTAFGFGARITGDYSVAMAFDASGSCEVDTDNTLGICADSVRVSSCTVLLLAWCGTRMCVCLAFRQSVCFGAVVVSKMLAVGGVVLVQVLFNGNDLVDLTSRRGRQLAEAHSTAADALKSDYGHLASTVQELQKLQSDQQARLDKALARAEEYLQLRREVATMRQSVSE